MSTAVSNPPVSKTIAYESNTDFSHVKPEERNTHAGVRGRLRASKARHHSLPLRLLA